MNNSFIEIENLEANTRYSFEIWVLGLSGTKFFKVTGFSFKTLLMDEFIYEEKSISNFTTIDVNWTTTFDFMEDKNNDLFYFITYQMTDKGKLISSFKWKLNMKIFPDLCKSTSNATNFSFFNDDRPFSRYYFKDPRKIMNDFKIKLDARKTSVKLSQLQNSTCYKIDIYPCTNGNQLLCAIQKTLFIETTSVKLDADDVTAKPVIQLLPIDVLVVFLLSCFLLTTTFVIGYVFSKRQYERNVDIPLNLLSDDDKWIIDRRNIVFTKCIGSGDFGKIFLGYIRPNNEKLVAIKTLVDTLETNEECFKQEAQIMRNFDAHHVIKLIGYSMEQKPLMVVMELMKYGDLKRFLQKNRPSKETENSDCDSTYTNAPINSSIKIRSVVEMAIEICDGMKYLEDQKFIHCDLACRNCMVHENFTIKIGGK
jgi:hypothetical protein